MSIVEAWMAEGPQDLNLPAVYKRLDAGWPLVKAITQARKRKMEQLELFA